MIAMHARLRQTDRRKKDEHHGNSTTIRSKKGIAR